MKVSKILSPGKLLPLMKIGFTQVMFAFVICGVCTAHNNHAQVLDRKITIDAVNVRFEQVLDDLASQAGVKFAYGGDRINLDEPVSVRAERRPLRAVLDDLLGPMNIRYKVHEREATIALKKLEGETQQRAPSPRSLNHEGSLRPMIPVTGRVTTVEGEPMAGVNVVVKGTSNGTSTDFDGLYVIHAEQNDIVVFSFIGYTSVEVIIASQTSLDVVLLEDMKSLGEVVINAGYYKTTKATQTGNIVKIDGEDLQKQPVSNSLAALQGRVTGLEVVQQTGVPGGNFQVRIRGQNSIANGNDPLYIIDGVPYTSTSMAFAETSQSILFNGTSPLNAINPADIESIEVLKDADATAIYGSRGSNGVILITTRRGKAGQTSVNLNVSTGVGTTASRMDLLSSAQYLEMRNEALQNDNVAPTEINAPDLLVWDNARAVDWQEVLLGGAAPVTDAQLNVSGGDPFTQYSIGAGYHREGTVFPGDNSDRRISTHIGINNRSRNEKFSSNISMKYSVNSTDLLKKDLTITALSLSPIAPPPRNANGALNWGAGGWTQAMPNPLSYMEMSYEAKTKNLLLSGTTGYAFRPGLEVKANVGYTDVAMNAITLTPLSALAPELAATSQHESVFASSTFSNWVIEPQLNWRPKIRDSKFDVLIGMTFLEQVREGSALIAKGFADEALMKNIGAASFTKNSTNYYSQYRYNAGFGRINYSYKDKYLINLTGRRDGSSRFGPGKQFSNFGAVGVAWIFSEEPFIKDAHSFLSFGKLRGSYGVTGNDQLGDYQYLDTYTTSGTYQVNSGLKPARLANPEFAWETNKKIEAGLHLGFLDDRIESSVSYYRNRSYDQLVGFALPPTTGFASMQGNLPAVVQNAGIEVEISTQNVKGDHFTWHTAFNISVPRNELLEFPDLENSPAYADRLVVGEPMSITKRYHYLDVDPSTGLYRFEDTNGDGMISSLDRQTVVFFGRDFFGGFLNTFRYKGFQLDLMFQFVKQTHYNYLSAFGAPPGNLTNQPDVVLDRWRNENDDTSIQRFTTSAQGLTAYTLLTGSDRAITDASFIRLKNVHLSYTFPASTVQKIHLQNLRLFMQAQNLLTLTSYQGLDPETGSGFLPPLRVLSGGVNVTF